MNMVSACPNAAELRSYLLGQTAEESASTIEEHLNACSPCQLILPELETEDDFVADLRVQAGRPQPANPLIDRLAGQFYDLIHQQPASSTEGTLSNSEGYTPTPDGPQETEADDLVAFLSPALQADELGRLGTYRVLRKLGAGGMGMVFLAEDTQLRRKVAIKTMLPRYAKSAQARERFLREGRAAAALEHPHIVAIYQVGEDNGVPFLAMPFLKGQTLDERLRQKPGLTEAEALRIAAEIADGLAAAHAQGLIHRDIKPGNIWLETPTGAAGSSNPDGHVKLLDFGLARASDEPTNLTDSGIVLGTPEFMAPEQARGDSVDGRADLFSLGCVLYLMLTGHRPFRGKTTMNILSALALEIPPEPNTLNPTVSPAVNELTMRLLAKKAEDRLQTARATASELRRLADTTNDVLRFDPAPRVVRRKPKKRFGWGVAAGLLFVATVMAGIFVIIRNKDGKEEKRIPIGKDQNVIIIPEEDSPIFPGAFVRYPARLEGVRGWTLTYKSMTHLRDGADPYLVSPDGSLVAFYDPHGPVIIRKVESGQLYRILGGSDWEVNSFAWSRDSKILGACGNDGSLLLWEVETGKRLAAPILSQPVIGLAWSPDNDYLAISCGDNAVRVWERTTNEILPIFANAGVCFTWSPDSKWIVCYHPNYGCGRHSILPPRQEIKLEWTGTQGYAWSPNSKLLAIGGDKKISFLDWSTGKVHRTIELKNEDCQWKLWNWLNDKCLLTSIGSKLALVDVATGKILGTTRDGLEIKNDIKERRFFTAIDRKYERLSFYAIDESSFDEKNYKLLKEKKLFTPKILKENARNIAWSPDGKTLATGGSGHYQCDQSFYDPIICLWDLATGSVRTKNEMRSVFKLSWSPDGNRLAMTPTYHRPGPGVRFWNVGGNGEIDEKPGNCFMELSPDHNLVVYGASNPVSIYELNSNKKMWSWKLSEKSMGYNPTFSPDGSKLAFISVDGPYKYRLIVNSLIDGKELFSVECKYGYSNTDTINWSPDGNYLVVAGQIFDIVEVKNGKYLNINQVTPLLVAPDSLMESYASWSPDGKVLATIKFPWPGHWANNRGVNQVLLMDFDTRKLRPIDKRMRGYHVYFAPVGKMLAVEYKLFVSLWDWEKGTYRGTLLPLGIDGNVAISPEGHFRASTKEAEKELVYVVETEKGQEILDPAEFAAKYHWTNDPDKVRLSGD